MNESNKVILRNSRAEQYLCAAKKNFRDGANLSETYSKTVICHFTDLHCDWARFQNVLDMIDYFKPNFAIHTGDLVCWDSNDQTDEFYAKIRDIETPIYNCIGNHETFRGEEIETGEYLHNRYISRLNNIHTDGKGYYYVDFNECNLRLIVLNNYENEQSGREHRCQYELKQEQCEWLINVLKECEQNDVGVIIASHEADEPVIPGSNECGFCQRTEPNPWGVTPKRCHIVADIVDSFKHGKAFKRKYFWENSGNKVEIECNFQKESEFICYMNGHRHGDYIGYLPSYPDQLSLGLTCSGCFPKGYHNIGDEVSDLPRIINTVSEDAVNFYVLDRNNKTLSVVRIGAYINDLFEERMVAKYCY